MTEQQQAAMRMALEALEKIGLRGWIERKEAAITALREALAEQPPCKTGSQCTSKCEQCRYEYECDKAEQPEQKRPQNCGTGYCSCIECVMEPEQEQEPVACRSEATEWFPPADYDEDGSVGAIARRHASENKEPVAWQWLNTGNFRKKLPKDAEPGAWNPLYTFPPASKPWVGLRKDETADLCEHLTMEVYQVRAIEAKLREKNA